MTDEASFDVFDELQWRGFIQQSTDENLGQWLAEKRRTVYAGFDPTADSLHVGHLVALMMLRRFQKGGHRPIALIGGATGMIGDPSGRSKERVLLSHEQLEHNIDKIRSQLETLLDFEGGGNAAILANNFDWMHTWSYLDFLRDVGKNFPVNVMLAKDSVKARLASEAGLSYTEFSYMLLQAYDFVHLHREFDCELQIGGSDQWGNITAGIDLARRMDGVQVQGIICPLLLKSDGTKMGKTEDGAVWLSSERMSPYKFYQYWLNVDDADVGKCLRFFTDLEREEIEELDRQVAADPGARAAQHRLAEEITRLIHGEHGLGKAKRASEILFGAEIGDLSDDELTEIFRDVPSEELPQDSLSGDGLNVLDAFTKSGLCKSKGDVRRLVKQGGAYVNNLRVEEIERQLTTSDLASETVMVLRSGKKKYALLRFV